MSNKQAPPGTQSVLRAVGLLKALARGERDMDLAELTSATDLTRTTAHRLLSALASEGLVTRDAARRTYRLGPAAITLGVRAQRTNDLRSVARPYLEELARESGETATLEILADGAMLILDEVLGSRLMGAQQEIGSTWALHATSTGKALLAALGADDRARLLRGRLTPRTDKTILTKGNLERDLERVGRRGYATSSNELVDGFSAVGAAILNADGAVVGAISVGGPSMRIGARRIAVLGKSVRAAAGAISSVLGHH